MKVFLLIALFSPLVLCYDAKFDALDADRIVADDALFDAYINCVLDKGPCSLEYSAEFRQLLPEMIATSCEKCSDIQRTNIRKSVIAMQQKRPADFAEFKAKYDPKGEYAQKITAFILGTN